MAQNSVKSRICLLLVASLLILDEDLEQLLLMVTQAAAAFLAVRTRFTLRRSALVAPQNSPMAFLLAHGDDHAYMVTMGIDRSTFNYLLSFFGPKLAAKRKDKRGRRRQLDARGSLALALHFLNTTMVETDLCLLFGLTPTRCCVRINEALKVLDEVVTSIPECAIELPTVDRMARLATALQSTYPLVENVFGFVDGVSFFIEHPGNPDLQNAFYNGWNSDCTVSNVIAYSVDGCIMWARINCPGALVSSGF